MHTICKKLEYFIHREYIQRQRMHTLCKKLEYIIHKECILYAIKYNTLYVKNANYMQEIGKLHT